MTCLQDIWNGSLIMKQIKGKVLDWKDKRMCWTSDIFPTLILVFTILRYPHETRWASSENTFKKWRLKNVDTRIPNECDHNQ